VWGQKESIDEGWKEERDAGPGGDAKKRIKGDTGPSPKGASITRSKKGGGGDAREVAVKKTRGEGRRKAKK